MSLVTLHHLSQLDLVDRTGEKVGRVRDCLLDPSSGRCDYLLMSNDGGAFSLGGGDLTPVPLSLITLRDNSLSLDATRDVIRGAPSFSTKEVSTFSDDYRAKLDSFWGLGRRQEELRPAAETYEPERPTRIERLSTDEEERYRRPA